MSARDHPVDVVIPVYRGLAETRRCVESALDARNATPCEIVAIDDASPDPALSEWLRVRSGERRFRLIVHAANRGFVASANEGMALHPERDVVLLNSDTEVADGWLDRLVACARREPGVATATPFSNNATICSFPRFCERNDLPPGTTTRVLDRRFAAANAGRSHPIPTGVGFCMFISRESLERVGAFDEERFGRGYGEEVDFCMRAARAGFRHLIAADVFVFHAGEVSFGSTGGAQRAAAQQVIDASYPEFQALVGEFVRTDPLKPLRDAVRARCERPLARLADAWRSRRARWNAR